VSLLLLAGCGVANAAEAVPPTEWHAVSTCTTNGTGQCSQVYAHPLGVVPVIQVTPDNLSAITYTYQITATTFRVRVMRSETQAWANRTLQLNLSAFAPSATAPSTTPPTTEPPASGAWPSPSATGVPAGWAPASTRTTNLVITVAGSVVQDVRLTGGASIQVRAANVTLRRIELVGGSIDNDNGNGCFNGMVLEDVSVLKGPATSPSNPPAIGTGGYTARRVKVQDAAEGLRVGAGDSGCGPVVVEDSWIRVRYPDSCGDWHGDGIQGYYGNTVTVRHSYMELVESGGCGGTAPFFYPGGQGNATATVDGLIVRGGGYSFRLGTAGSVKGLRVVNNSWGYGPVDVDNCGQVSPFDARRVTLDANYQPTDGTTIAC
jgi:hypothetical protein